MTTLTKDQVRKLTPEQQEAFGQMQVQRTQLRQQFVERARRGMTASEGLFAGLTSGLALLCIPFPRVLPIAIIAVVGLITYYVSRLHRRLDAIQKLHDLDVKRQENDPSELVKPASLPLRAES